MEGWDEERVHYDLSKGVSKEKQVLGNRMEQLKIWHRGGGPKARKTSGTLD